MPRGSGHPDLSQRPRREAPGLLTGLAILERELGIIDYERYLVRRRLAARPAASRRESLLRDLRDLERRRELALRKLDELHAEDEERIERGIEAIRARASRSPYSRRETREEARRRLGIR